MLIQLHLQHWHAHIAENAQWYDLPYKLVKLLQSHQNTLHDTYSTHCSIRMLLNKKFSMKETMCDF
jgi:hypothetical protein